LGNQFDGEVREFGPVDGEVGAAMLASAADDGQPPVPASWVVAIFPFMEEKDKYD
jgi:hypothetical protein